MSEFDDQFGRKITGCGFSCQDHRPRFGLEILVPSQFVIMINGVKQVEELPLIFVDSFDLDIKHGIRVEEIPILFFQPANQLLFFQLFQLPPFFAELLVFLKGFQAAKFLQVFFPVMADPTADQFG